MDMSRDVRMHWTGCTNTCGQVQVADIGFLGCQTKNPRVQGECGRGQGLPGREHGHGLAGQGGRKVACCTGSCLTSGAPGREVWGKIKSEGDITEGQSSAQEVGGLSLQLGWAIVFSKRQWEYVKQ